ncbi:MAG: MerR family transcriptional regulator [Gammaproteobacteria bacterium]|nr:MerR family transcriptional regulator [Gammaproteobacteria bacterium]
MDDLIRIGQFAQLGRVSVKALRYYDAEGLLRPAHVDAHSGYRYYHVEQTRQLAMITNLRAAGFSIDEISGLLADEPGDDDLLQRIAQRRGRLLENRQAIERQLDTLETLTASLGGGTRRPWSQVRLTSVDEQWVHAVRGPQAGKLNTVAAMFETAEARVARVDARLDAPPFMLIHEHNGTDQQGNLEVCIPVIPEAARDIETRLVEGSELACSIAFAGPYEQGDSLVQRMLEWLSRAGLAAAGPLREIYHRFGADEEGYRLPHKVLAQRREQYLTELLLPISSQ